MNSTAIRIVPLIASKTGFFYRKLAEALTSRTGIGVAVVDDLGWHVRNHLLCQGIASLRFICGRQYGQKIEREGSKSSLRALSIRTAARYVNQPIYFPDVVVRWDRLFPSLSDLRERIRADHKPIAHLGYTLCCPR